MKEDNVFLTDMEMITSPNTGFMGSLRSHKLLCSFDNLGNGRCHYYSKEKFL